MLRRMKRKIRWVSVPSNPSIEKNLILSFLVLVIFLAITYGYFVKQTILNVVTREEVEEEMIDLGSAVSQLEVRYIELKNRIDLDFAYSLGYKDASEIKFVSRNVMDKALTINQN
jgi:hypothetical protein